MPIVLKSIKIRKKSADLCIIKCFVVPLPSNFFSKINNKTNDNNMIIHIPTGTKFSSRKEAKEKMGHYVFNRELKLHNFMFSDNNIQTYDTDEIIF